QYHDVISHYFFFSSRRRHTRSKRDWSSDVCSSDLSTNVANRSFYADTELNASLWDEGTARALRVALFGEHLDVDTAALDARAARSEERRVGKERVSESSSEYGKRGDYYQTISLFIR